jgi:hypothetical protein
MDPLAWHHYPTHLATRVGEYTQRHGYCGVRGTDGAATTCNSHITELPELTFHAVLSGGAQEMRFERARG